MELLKKLTGKNPADYEPVASNLVDSPDVSLFKELVNKDDFLFPYIKQNVAKRIYNACNEKNFQNLYLFLNYYSPFYDDMIASVLARFDRVNADKKMLELLCTGTEPEKCYAAKYFALYPQSGNETILRGYVNSENEYLMENSILALKNLNDEATFNKGLQELSSNDDYEAFHGAKLVAIWGDESKIPMMFESMKRSMIPEYVALEINNLKPFVELVDSHVELVSLALCHILSSLGEMISLDSIFELELKEVLQKLAMTKDSAAAVVLMIAHDLFEEFASNDEYLFDLDKNTKDEVFAINEFLSKIPLANLENDILEEAYEDSLFIQFVVKFIDSSEVLQSLLEGSNETVILSAVERLKSLGVFTEEYKKKALNAVQSESIKSVIIALCD